LTPVTVAQVEFSGGALRCGEHITVRKIGDSQKVTVPSLQECFPHLDLLRLFMDDDPDSRTPDRA